MDATIEQRQVRFINICAGQHPTMVLGRVGSENFELVPLSNDAECAAARARAAEAGRYAIAAMSINNGTPQSMLFTELEPDLIEAVGKAYGEHIGNLILRSFERLAAVSKKHRRCRGTSTPTNIRN